MSIAHAKKEKKGYNDCPVMKALVTGGTGFVGSHLVEELVKHGYEIRILTRKKDYSQK